MRKRTLNLHAKTSTPHLPFHLSFQSKCRMYHCLAELIKSCVADGTLIVQDDKFVAKPQTYDSKTQPYPGQLLQVLTYLNSNYSSKRRASPDDYFDMPHTQKQWQLRICDRKTRSHTRYFLKFRIHFHCIISYIT